MLPLLSSAISGSGEWVEVHRGAKRRSHVEIKPDTTIEYKQFDLGGLRKKCGEEAIRLLGEVDSPALSQPPLMTR